MKSSYYVSVESMPSKCWLWDSACLKVKAQAISPILSAGVPELDVQPLDNIIIDFVHIVKGGYQADLRTVRIKGMSDAIVDSIKYVFLDLVSVKLNRSIKGYYSI